MNSVRPLSAQFLSKLRIMVFNTENLFIYLDHYANQDVEKLSEKDIASFTEWKKAGLLEH